jgi:hypothetical protein
MSDITKTTENKLSNIASDAENQLIKALDEHIKIKMSALEDDNKEQRAELMALIDERFNLYDSIEEYNVRLRKCFNVSHLHDNASRIELFGAASDYELTVYGL